MAHTHTNEQFTDHYEVLGISQDATADEIKRAFREKSKQYHPDQFENSPRYSFYVEMQQRINTAYNVLSDSERRAAYDRELEQQHVDPETQAFHNRAREEFAIAVGYMEAGEFSGAIEALKKCLFLVPDFHEARLLLAAMLLEAQEFDKAREVANAMTEHPATKAQGYVTLAECDIFDPEKGRMDEAVTSCEEAIRYDPKFVNAYRVKAQAYIVGNRPKKALGYLRVAVAQVGHHPDLYLAAAAAYTALREFGLAEELILKVVQHFDRETAETIASNFVQMRASTLEEIKSAGKEAQRQDERGGSLGGGFWFWTLVAFAVPPHFWGVPLLIYGLVHAAKQRTASSHRSKKGIADPDPEQMRRYRLQHCPRCIFSVTKTPRWGESYMVCTKMGGRLRIESDPKSPNPCNGLFFYSEEKTSPGASPTLSQNRS